MVEPRAMAVQVYHVSAPECYMRGGGGCTPGVGNRSTLAHAGHDTLRSAGAQEVQKPSILEGHSIEEMARMGQPVMRRSTIVGCTRGWTATTTCMGHRAKPHLPNGSTSACTRASNESRTQAPSTPDRTQTSSSASSMSSHLRGMGHRAVSMGPAALNNEQGFCLFALALLCCVLCARISSLSGSKGACSLLSPCPRVPPCP
jgi:hypothetical protein